jgi:predicted ferric reductase
MIIRMKKGALLLGVIAIITAVCWLITLPHFDAPFLLQYSQFLGALALVGFACANFITTRHRCLDTLFNGLDKAYITHKWLGITSLVLAAVHVIIFNMQRVHNEPSAASAENTFYHIGGPSLVLFIVFIFIALLAKKMNYEKWKSVHKFLLLPYVIGLVHYYGSSVYGAFGLSPFSIWLNCINLIGILSAIYSVFYYENSAFLFRYKVSAVRTVSNETVEITGKAIEQGITFKPGQFTFLKIPKTFPSHPFTMSGAPEKDAIQFTIKNLGDHTAKLITTIKPDDEFAVTAPHGMFDYTMGGKHQIWIAGGIGVTPFRSFYMADIPEDYSIDFFYAYHGEEEGVYLDEMQALSASNLRLHLIDDTEQGFLTVEKIKEHINADNPVDIYFCGPKPMRESLIKNLKKSGIHVLDFHFEEFQFGR